MPDKNDFDLYAEFTDDWTIRSIWPFIGGVVQDSIAKLIAEGFSKEEATLFVKALGIMQLYRMNFPLPPIRIRYWVPDAKVYTEQEIIAMAEAGETIPQIEYTGFEGTR